jgi:hypothetical protein
MGVSVQYHAPATLSSSSQALQPLMDFGLLDNASPSPSVSCHAAPPSYSHHSQVLCHAIHPSLHGSHSPGCYFQIFFPWYMPRSQSSIFIYPRLLSLFRNKICFTEWGCQPHAQPPLPWRIGVSLLVWSLSFVLSGLGDLASSYATAGIARRISATRKPPHHDKVETPSRRPAALYPRGKDPRYPLHRKLGGPQSRSGHRG